MRRTFRPMPAIPILLLMAVVLAPTPARGQSSDPRARALLAHSLEAMGGAPRFEGLRSIRVAGVGHEHALEQSERPEGPWLPTYRQFSELRDIAGMRLRRMQEQRGFWSADWQEMTTVADTGAAAMRRGERSAPAPGNVRTSALESLALSPERILLTARAARDARVVGDTILQGVAHDVVAFTWDARPVRLFLNRNTRLPAGYTIPAPAADVFAEVWGDTPTLTLWSLWSLEPGGWLYPRQFDRLRFGHTLSSELVQSVAFDAPAPADSFAIPDETRAAFATFSTRTLGSMRPGMSFRGERTEPAELAPGVVTIPGSYAATFIEQPDGIVVLDAPMTSGWSEAVLAEAAARFPDKRVKLVVSTSDAWLHIGGLREYAARGVPIVTLDLNRAIVERLLAAPRNRSPDAWAGARHSADLRDVSERTVIGSGPNRIELYPVRGEGGERMMLAWLPEHRILYASDLVQIGPDGSAFWPEYLLEVAWVVERHALDPVTVFAMHTPAIPWTQVQDLIGQLNGVRD